MRSPALALLALVFSTCGLEQPILNQATEWGPDWVPDAPEPFDVRGQVFAFPGGSVDFYAASGTHLPNFTAPIQPNGIFRTEFPGTTDYRNLVLVASDGPMRLLGLAARIPRNVDIYYDPDNFIPEYHIGGMTWGEAAGAMTNLDDATTTVTLAMLRAAHRQGTSMGTASVESTNEAIGTLSTGIKNQSGPSYLLYRQVQRMLAYGSRSKTFPPLFVFPDATGLFLNPDFLTAADVDYTGDGMPDHSAAAFEAALKAAAGEIVLAGCSGGGRATVVFMVEADKDNRDLNCSAIDPFKHATDAEGKTMYITGGMYTSDPTAQTAACESDGKKAADCLTPAEWAEVNQKLGNWTPNLVPLRDDGQVGDSSAGDGIWTAVLELPYISTEAGSRKGVRIGYKYTYGLRGQGWTGTEEWPGNNRILELEDWNGDSLIIRYDYFGDETSNKNVANINTGLCGSTQNPWAEQAAAGCFFDTWENRIDTDGDCVLDAYPQAGTVVPNCIESEIPGHVQLKDSAYLGAGDKISVAAVTPASGPNGGGFLVEVLGTGFSHGNISGIQVNTADTGEVPQNQLPGYFIPEPTRVLFTAPHMPAANANVVVLGGEESRKGAMKFTVKKPVGCSLLYPAEMPEGDIPAGVVSKESYPVLGRLEVADSLFLPNLKVELGLSPACCYEDESCTLGVVSCLDLPKPTWQQDWTWFPMQLDPACMVPAGSGLEDCAGDVSQFVGAIVPAIEQVRHRYVVRYSFDFGLSWDHCDLPQDDGNWGNGDGIKPIDMGMMWVD